MEPNKKLMSCSWRQPYLNWTQHVPLRIAKDDKHRQLVNVEIAVLDAIDNLINSGLTHSTADVILRSLMVNSKE
jgi:hypothetical protein